MRQEIDAANQNAIDYVLDGDTHLRAIQQQLAKAEQAHDGAELGRLHAELDSADADTTYARAPKLLAGLGFLEEQAVKTSLSVTLLSISWIHSMLKPVLCCICNALPKMSESKCCMISWAVLTSMRNAK